jgi:uncharacterized membrane protein
MLRCMIILEDNIRVSKKMPFAATLFQNTGAFVSAVTFAHVVHGVFSLAALAGFVMFFRPLLTGMARALMLTLRPRETREQRAARRNLRNAASLQRVINTGSAANDAADLRAVASRG